MSAEPESFVAGPGAAREIARLMDRIAELEAERDRAWDRVLRERARADDALPIAFADCEALVVAMLEEMAAAERQNDNWSGSVVLTGAALAVSLGQHRTAECNERAIVAAHREAAGFNSSKAGGEARMKALTPAKRKKIATKAARARWAAKKGE